MTNCARLMVVMGALAAGAGCLDLSEEGKVFACPGCAFDAGGTGGGGGGTVDCTCQLPEPRCEGSTRISAAFSICLADASCAYSLIETPCPGGCAAGACVGEPCLGLVCSQPPNARCESPTALRVFAAPGACQAGGCLYGSADVSCDCVNDKCVQNPCLGVVCNQPPGSACVGNSLRTFQAPGTCDAATGRCSYSAADTSCGVGGCAAAQCTNDKCAGVVCNQAPAATCLGATTLKLSVTPGTCSPTSGACSYTTQTVTCDPGKECSQGACVTISAGCNSSNCAGCCNGNTCVPLTGQSNAQCGAAGAACGSCGGAAPVCQAGGCVSKCGGVTCDQPPSATCFDPSTLTKWAPTGSCNPATGLCSYSPSNVTCGAGNTCAAGACSCPSESDASLCGRLAKNCGAVSSTDSCGVPRTVNCGSCTLPQTCNASVCSCAPEADATFCSRLGKSCGAVSGTDNCGAARTAACGSCTAPSNCTASNVCACVPESAASLCSRLGKSCGAVSATDNCGGARSVNCGGCTAPATCSLSNVCACVSESASAFCSRLGKNCGVVNGTDNCGGARSVNCGGCTSPLSCGASNVCACVSETNGAFCSRLGKNCGTVSGTDNCGAARSAACGSCSSPQSCGGGGVSNVCGGSGTRLNFSPSWQVIPNTGAQTVEFKCGGTVTTTAAGGTRCSLAGGDPVQIRINGAVYQLYPGCSGDRPSNCMTSITPTGATYADWGLLSAGKLLCDAMGWPWSKGLSDNNPGTVDRPVAVVQTNPSVIGTDSGLKNFATYIACEP